MKLRGAIMTWSLVTLVLLPAAPLSPPGGKDPRSLPMPDVLTRLADESYAVRENATRELWKQGEHVLPELRKAAEGADPEAAVRARDLIRKIELGILPDSSPRIVELVMRYDRGGVEEQRIVINELKRERAWRQILKLYALEKDAESLEMLGDAVRGVAVDAARECLASEPPDIEGAFSYLNMARPEAPELMAAAALHRANGSLEEELKKSEGTTGERAHLWRYALLTAAGRLEEAAAEAEKAGLDVVSARLQLLAGNPVPWLKGATPSPQTMPPVGLTTYRDFAVRNWEGKPVPGDVLRSLRRLARGGDEDERSKALRLLFLVGDHAEAEKVLLDLDRCAAFHYFESAERVEEALQALGLDPAKPDYKGWTSKRFRVLIDDPDEEDNELAELALLGYFLEHRGLFKELDDAFVAPLVELARADQEMFIRTASRLFSGPFDATAVSAVRPVIKAAGVFAGDDEVRWMQVVENLFEARENPDRLWNWLGTMDPGLERPQRLEWLCRIFGLLGDPADERARFFNKAWQEIDKLEPKERQPHLQLLAQISDSIGDTTNFFRCAEALGKESEDVATMRATAASLALLGRWNEAAAKWQKVVEKSPGFINDHVNASACLRRAGDTEAANRQEHRAELLAMGETRVQFECGDAFALSGDFQRAAVWWKRAAAECTRDTIYFQVSLIRLTDHAQSIGDWNSMAALSEAQALQQAISGNGAFRMPPNFSMSGALQLRIDAGLARGLSKLAKERAAAIEEIERWSALPYADLALADHFFAPLRTAGLLKPHETAFERIWNNLTKRIEEFPDCDNTRNSAAWLASRANRKLTEAAAYLEKALERNPRQAAYLDTMAEVHFAGGDREKAVELSTRALRETPSDLQLIRQHQRFATGPLPPK